MDKWNRIESTEREPYKYSHLIFDKEQRIYNEENTILSTNRCRINCTSMCQKMNLDTDLTFFKKTNPKWITDLNIKHKTIKFL